MSKNKVLNFQKFKFEELGSTVALLLLLRKVSCKFRNILLIKG